MGRTKPLITDSGGFQAFSLANVEEVSELKGGRVKVEESLVVQNTENGLVFRSYRDGQYITLTPETSIQFQKQFGADIILPLDYLLPNSAETAVGSGAAVSSFARTHRWQERSMEEHLRQPSQQALYSIIHGGTNLEMRRRSVQLLEHLPWNGYAIGGSLGASRSEIRPLVQEVLRLLRPEMPVHLLGIGDLESIVSLRDLPIDTYDSSYPTILARHGKVLCQGHAYKISGTEHRNAFEPLVPDCRCSVCRRYTRAYLHHLSKANEWSAGHLLTIHNLHAMAEHFRALREEILAS